MPSPSLEEIQDEFADLDLPVTDDEVLQKLQELCDQYSIDANKISCEYFSFNTKSKTSQGKPPTLDTLVLFENEKLRHVKREGPRRPLDPIEGVENLPDCPPPSHATPTRLPGGGAAKRNLTPDTQINKKFVPAVGSPSLSSSFSSPSGGASQPLGKYADRKNSGEIVLKHNEDLPGDWTASRGPVSISCDEGQVGLSKPYRYMFERMREKAAVLDETICRMEENLREKFGFGDSMDFRLAEVEPQIAVGRICCDADGRLNPSSILLQGSVDSCGGHTIPVDVSSLASYSLFPGQIVALECTNPSGGRLLATNIYSEAALPLRPPPPEADGRVLDLTVACGPFTTLDSDSWQPLEDILARIKEARPHVAILLGPFVDMKNGWVENHAESYEQLFGNLLRLVAAAVEELDTEVVLVPSQRDAHAHCVYPQPPFVLGSDFSSKIRCVSDPACISVCGVSVGLTSSDILFHLGKEELSHPARTGDRLSRLAGHLVSQRSFYPLYPPNEEQSLDLEHQEAHGLLSVAPHLLLLPSDLVPFARDLEGGTTVLNPGRLTKGSGPGTFARLHVRCADGDLKVKAEILRI